jgi:hypothetical protein
MSDGFAQAGTYRAKTRVFAPLVEVLSPRGATTSILVYQPYQLIYM